uniref:Uncharacterized protein n=1 Tax=Romanomermis culicivorax TaxID=13658 RepID=A0A915INZ8_ROMCU
MAIDVKGQAVKLSKDIQSVLDQLMVKNQTHIYPIQFGVIPTISHIGFDSGGLLPRTMGQGLELPISIFSTQMKLELWRQRLNTPGIE